MANYYLDILQLGYLSIPQNIAQQMVQSLSNSVTLSGWWLKNPSEKYECQLGWLETPFIWKKWKHVPKHQAVMVCLCGKFTHTTPEGRKILQQMGPENESIHQLGWTVATATFGTAPGPKIFLLDPECPKKFEIFPVERCTMTWVNIHSRKFQKPPFLWV